MGFFFHFAFPLILSVLLLQSSAFASDSGLSLACVLKDGESKEVPFSLALKAGEAVETTAAVVDNPKISYKVSAKLQETTALEQTRMAIDYEIEKTDDGKKVKQWKFPREIIARKSGFQIQIKGKTLQTSLQISCRDNEPGE